MSIDSHEQYHRAIKTPVIEKGGPMILIASSIRNRHIVFREFGGLSIGLVK